MEERPFDVGILKSNVIAALLWDLIVAGVKEVGSLELGFSVNGEEREGGIPDGG